MAQPDLQSTRRIADAPAGSRGLLAATVAYIVLVVAGLAALGTTPAATETGSHLVGWLREHRSAVQWCSMWAFTLSAPALAVMLAIERRLLPSPYSDVFFIGGIAILISSAVQSWFWAGLGLHAEQLEPATARALLDVAVFFGPILTGATTTMMAPVTLLALRSKAGLPMWLGLLGAAAFVEQSIETITIFGSTGFTQPGGPMNLQLGAGLTLAWMMAFGLWGGLRGRALNPAA
jgi:hypothetical protein